MKRCLSNSTNNGNDKKKGQNLSKENDTTLVRFIAVNFVVVFIASIVFFTFFLFFFVHFTFIAVMFYFDIKKNRVTKNRNK